jgi:hypothetical protein
VTFSKFYKLRVDLFAAFDGERAARVKATAAWDLERAGQIAGKGDARAA